MADQALTTAAVVRRALLIWGLGHVALGDRRGWLLTFGQAVAVGGLIIVAPQLIDGTHWLLVFPLLATLIVTWIGQAIHAYRLAIRRGASAGGEIQVALALPAAVVLLTVFWLFGGRHGSPAATIQEYLAAWMNNRPDIARQLFTTPPSTIALGGDWATQSGWLREKIAAAKAHYGSSSGLDPARPFASLRFRSTHRPDPLGQGRVATLVEIVRSRRVETTLFGIIPTAGQETVSVEPVLLIWLQLEPQQPPSWLPFGRLESEHWLIGSVDRVAGAQ